LTHCGLAHHALAHFPELAQLPELAHPGLTHHGLAHLDTFMALYTGV
jgi:hypothetical protein